MGREAKRKSTSLFTKKKKTVVLQKQVVLTIEWVTLFTYKMERQWF